MGLWQLDSRASGFTADGFMTDRLAADSMCAEKQM